MNLSNISSREIIPGYHGKLIHAKNMSIAFWDVDEGAVVPEHSHINEQIMQVLEGRFEFTLGKETKVYQPGEIVIIPSQVTHSGKALTPCRLMDIFSPVRQEYK